VAERVAIFIDGSNLYHCLKGDFATAVEAVQGLGKHIENAMGRTGQSRLLRQTCDRFILLTKDFLQDCWLP